MLGRTKTTWNEKCKYEGEAHLDTNSFREAAEVILSMSEQAMCTLLDMNRCARSEAAVVEIVDVTIS